MINHFHLAALVLQHRSGFFFVLAIAALPGIQGAAAIGTDAVVAHSAFFWVATSWASVTIALPM